jgi:hypothetical protein
MKTTSALYAGAVAVGFALLLAASQAQMNAGQPSVGAQREAVGRTNLGAAARIQPRVRRLDQFSTFRSVKREKSFVLFVTT